MAVSKASSSKPTKKSAEQKLIITHTFNAPRERVWKAYTDPKQIAQWWGLDGASLVACDSDVRVGGMWRFVLRDPDGNNYIVSGIFREVSAPNRLTYTDGFGEPNEPRPESLISVTFDDLPNGKTRITKSLIATSTVH